MRSERANDVVSSSTICSRQMREPDSVQSTRWARRRRLWSPRAWRSTSWKDEIWQATIVQSASESEFMLLLRPQHQVDPGFVVPHGIAPLHRLRQRIQLLRPKRYRCYHRRRLSQHHRGSTRVSNRSSGIWQLTGWDMVTPSQLRRHRRRSRCHRRHRSRQRQRTLQRHPGLPLRRTRVASKGVRGDRSHDRGRLSGQAHANRRQFGQELPLFLAMEGMTGPSMPLMHLWRRGPCGW